jgi:uncharacterized protein
MAKHGLNVAQVELIKRVLWPYKEQIEKVCLFGSRAKGTHRANSDIDLVLYGALDETVAGRLWTLFEESSLPFKVDVKTYAHLTYPPLKKHIDEVGVLFLSQADLMDAN